MEFILGYRAQRCEPKPPSGALQRQGHGDFFDKDTFSGKPIIIRYRWSRRNPHEPHFEQAFSIDNGETWETNWILRLRREDELIDRRYFFPLEFSSTAARIISLKADSLIQVNNRRRVLSAAGIALALASVLMSASPTAALTALQVRGAPPVQPLASEPPVKIIIDQRLAAPLALGRVVMQYYARNLQLYLGICDERMRPRTT
ncbi:MAG: DUF6130 family protein [Vulcanimicrobiaceae bacterium]